MLTLPISHAWLGPWDYAGVIPCGKGRCDVSKCQASTKAQAQKATHKAYDQKPRHRYKGTWPQTGHSNNKKTPKEWWHFRTKVHDHRQSTATTRRHQRNDDISEQRYMTTDRAQQQQEDTKGMMTFQNKGTWPQTGHSNNKKTPKEWWHFRTKVHDHRQSTATTRRHQRNDDISEQRYMTTDRAQQQQEDTKGMMTFQNKGTWPQTGHSNNNKTPKEWWHFRTLYTGCSINKRPLGLKVPLSNDTWSMIHIPMNTKWPWFDFTIPPKVKCHEVCAYTEIPYIINYICVLCKIGYNAPFRRFLKVKWPWFDIERLTKVKCNEVNW